MNTYKDLDDTEYLDPSHVRYTIQAFKMIKWHTFVIRDYSSKQEVLED